MEIKGDLLICLVTKVSSANRGLEIESGVEFFTNFWRLFSAMPSQPGGYQGQPGYNQYPPDQYGQQYMSGGSYPPSRPMYPVYPPEMER